MAHNNQTGQATLEGTLTVQVFYPCGPNSLSLSSSLSFISLSLSLSLSLSQKWIEFGRMS